jgi:hypothetical protein
MSSGKPNKRAMGRLQLAEVRRLHGHSSQHTGRRMLEYLKRFHGTEQKVQQLLGTARGALKPDRRLSASVLQRIEKLFNETFNRLDEGQIVVRKATNRAWVAQRRSYEKLIGLPARRRGWSECVKYPENERDTRLHPIVCAVNRAEREGYVVPADVMREYNEVIDGTEIKLFDNELFDEADCKAADEVTETPDTHST